MAILRQENSGNFAVMQLAGSDNNADTGILLNPSSAQTIYIQEIVVSNCFEGVVIRPAADGTTGVVSINKITFSGIGGNVLTISGSNVTISELNGTVQPADIVRPYHVYHPHVVKLISLNHSGQNETPNIPLHDISIASIDIISTNVTVLPIGIFGSSDIRDVKLGTSKFHILTAFPYALQAFHLTDCEIGGDNNLIRVNNPTGQQSDGTDTGILFRVANHGQTPFISSNNRIIGYIQESLYSDYHEGFHYCPNYLSTNCVAGVTDLSNLITINIDTRGQPILRTLPPVPLMTDTPDVFSVKAENHLIAWIAMYADLKNYALWVSSRTFQNNTINTQIGSSVVDVPDFTAIDASKVLAVNSAGTALEYITVSVDEGGGGGGMYEFDTFI